MTLNGFLVSLMEKIPADGEKVALDAYGYKFSVLSTDNTMINQVKVTKIDGEEDN